MSFRVTIHFEVTKHKTRNHPYKSDLIHKEVNTIKISNSLIL